jgi:hypothetical protein
MDETDEKPGSSKDEFENTLVAIWAKAVDTQMHFNEMSVKSRQLGLTFVAAALGLAVFLFSRSGPDAKFAFTATVRGHQFVLHVAEAIILAAAASVYAVKLLDLGVYHKMLRGAVAFGEDLEEVHIRKLLGLNKGMTQAISHFSRFSDGSVSVEDGKNVYSGKKKQNAGQKINRFYWLVITSLVACALIMFAVGNNLI